MDSGAQQKVADLVWSLWQEGRVTDMLPSDMRPATRVEGYAIQARLAARSSRPVFGWKIAATSKAGQAHINVNGPIAGRILAERVHESGARLRFGANRMAVAEPEFAFRMGRDLPPREGPYAMYEVMAAVAALHPAIEVPDSRFSDFTKVGAPQLIAENACGHEFVLGPAAGEHWRRIDLARHAVKAVVKGKLERDGSGANVLGDPRIALTWIANELSGLGIALKAGEIVTTGTCATPLPITAGDEVAMDFGTLGKVSAAFGRD